VSDYLHAVTCPGDRSCGGYCYQCRINKRDERIAELEAKCERLEQRPTPAGMAWVVWSNTDLIEGRGRNYPLAVCALEATARRMGKKRYVQGANCPVEQVPVYIKDGRTYGPVDKHQPTTDDRNHQKRVDKQNEVYTRAKQLGLSDEDLRILSVSN